MVKAEKKEKTKILIVEDDIGIQNQLKWALTDKYDLLLADSQQSALLTIRKDPPAIVILDLGLPPDANGATEGLATLQAISEQHPDIKVIIASGNSDIKNALKSIELGAYDFYSKPIDIDTLNHIISRAWHLSLLEKENKKRQQEKLAQNSLYGIITDDPKMLECCHLIKKIADSDISILVTGESGTGKELIANAIHANSLRASGPLIAINCAAIPENLLESELFGYEKGAFTGAISTTIGKIEMAHHGVLFLDEIGDLPLSLQAKLLRFIEDRVIERVGGRKKISIDTRIICATHQNLEDMISKASFREDLYYRLNEFHIHLPALRDREGDVALLSNYFMAKYAKQFKKNITAISEKTLEILSRHPWPGNVRELENKIKKAVIMANGNTIKPMDIDIKGVSEITIKPLQEIKEEYERSIVQKALTQTRGNISLAAKLLDISRPKLYEMIENYEIAI